MFTEKELLDAHAKVKSGADYPRYVQELKDLGVVTYDFLVENGHNIFFGKDGHSVETTPKYGNLKIACTSSKEQLKHTIVIHQQGQTDFLTFCIQAAEAGVEKWVSDLQRMEVIYLDRNGTEMLLEPIPAGEYK